MMPRAPRIEYAGAVYHLMSRGNRLEPIFVDDADRQLLLATLGEAARSAGWVVHGFVLMRNHYHLLVETPRPTLVRGMQYLNSAYTRRYNVRHRTFGHLFQGRYKALLVDGEEGGYFLTVSDYIHLNPVRTGLVRNGRELLADPWSSAGWLAGTRRKQPSWLSGERVYGELGGGRGRRARKMFREYLEQRVGEVLADGGRKKEDGFGRIRRGWCLGGEGFVERMKGRLEELGKKGVKTETWNDEAADELEEMRAGRDLQTGSRILGEERIENLERWDRYLLAEWVRSRNRVRIDWLGARIGNPNRGSMSGSLFQLRKKLKEQRKLQAKWRLLSEN